MKTTRTIKAAAFSAVIFAVAACLTPAFAQPYETSLTTSNYTQDFDGLAQSCAGGGIPAGWVMAEGVGLPKYDSALGTTSTTNFATIAPLNFTNFNLIAEGGASGCSNDLSPGDTFGGRFNYGDQPTTYANRALGFRSSNPSWESPTNHLMFGFTNNTGSNILSLAVTNNIKLYGYDETPAMVYFYYSTNG
jgi:hypothetical protein